MGSEPESSKSEEELWLICPVCKKPNPAGKLHCQHCWGASLHSVKPVTSSELSEITKREQSRRKRLKAIKIVAISFTASILLPLAVFSSLYYFTDIAFAPSPTLSSSPPPGEWTMFRHDLSHTSSTSLSGNAPQGRLKWEFSTGAPIHSSPTVVNGIVYFGSRDSKLYALDAETGAKLWEYQAGSWIESSPTVANGIVYFGSNDGKLYAIDALTGDKVWDFSAHYPVKSSPAVASGMVYFGSGSYFIYALDALNGTKVWSFETGSYVDSSPAVANGIVYVGSMDGSFYALNAQDGRLRLRFKSGSGVLSSPAVSDGIAYFNSGGFLYAIDGSARNWPWENELRPYWLQFWAMGLAPRPPPVSGYMWRLFLGRTSPSSPVVTDDAVYATSDNRLYRIDIEKLDFDKIKRFGRSEMLHYLATESGWKFSAEGKISSSPALGNNVLYVGSEDGRLYAVDATNGKKLWDFPTGDKITSSPALVGDTVYVTSHDGKLYAIE